MSNFSVFHNEPQEMSKGKEKKTLFTSHVLDYSDAVKSRAQKHEATTSSNCTFNSNRLKMSMHNYVNSNMDRENEQHVYVNEESNSQDVRTGRQISTTHQTSGSSVGDSVRIRNYRAATVCSVLLCVVLLTAIIVLGTNYTQETRQLQSDNTKLINERDALLLKNNDLIKVHFKEYNGWIYGHSSLYYISSEKKSWNESRSYCTERGADLIIINNKEEHDFVQKNIVNDCSSYWIGLTDIDEEGSWKWVDGSTPTFRFWWTNEPKGQRRENCVQYYISNWADFPCHDAHLWICEKNMFK